MTTQSEGHPTAVDRILCWLGAPRWITTPFDRYCRACGEVVRGDKPQEWCELTYPHRSHVVNQYDSRYRATLCHGILPDGSAR